MSPPYHPPLCIAIVIKNFYLILSQLGNAPAVGDKAPKSFMSLQPIDTYWYDDIHSSAFF
jgi:hypothetical protein